MRTQAKKLTKYLLSAGVVGSLLFVVVVSIDAFTRPGFDLTKHAISMLSLGDMGWLMRTMFIGCGSLVVLSAFGIRQITRGMPRSTWGPLLIGLFGSGLILAGIFPPSASLGFPIGTPADQQPVFDTTSTLHSVAFMISMSSVIAACFVFARYFKKSKDTSSAQFMKTLGIVIPVLVVIGMVGIVAAGIPFYIAAILDFLLVFYLSQHFLRKAK